MSKSVAAVRINDYRPKMQKGQSAYPEKLKAGQKLSCFPGFYILVGGDKSCVQRLGRLLALACAAAGKSRCGASAAERCQAWQALAVPTAAGQPVPGLQTERTGAPRVLLLLGAVD